MLNGMSEFSFDSLESAGRIDTQPQKNSFATLLHGGDGLWESIYSLFSLPSSGSMTIACFDGSANETLTISVDAGMYVCMYVSTNYHVSGKNM